MVCICLFICAHVKFILKLLTMYNTVLVYNMHTCIIYNTYIFISMFMLSYHDVAHFFQMRKLKPRLDKRITKISVTEKFHSQLYNSVLSQTNDYIATTSWLKDRDIRTHLFVDMYVIAYTYIYGLFRDINKNIGYEYVTHILHDFE